MQYIMLLEYFLHTVAANHNTTLYTSVGHAAVYSMLYFNNLI